MLGIQLRIHRGWKSFEVEHLCRPKNPKISIHRQMVMPWYKQEASTGQIYWLGVVDREDKILPGALFAMAMMSMGLIERPTHDDPVETRRVRAHIKGAALIHPIHFQ
jgi:hypothetical protein